MQDVALGDWFGLNCLSAIGHVTSNTIFDLLVQERLVPRAGIGSLISWFNGYAIGVCRMSLLVIGSD